MITQLGKELKKLRIDLGITLADMATQLGKSSSFLSAVETGRKRIPDDFLDLLSKHYEPIRAKKDEFQVLINHARKEVPLPEDASLSDAMLATALTRKFKSLSPKEISELMEFLDKKKDS